jgi:hypothetical protein
LTEVLIGRTMDLSMVEGVTNGRPGRDHQD